MFYQLRLSVKLSPSYLGNILNSYPCLYTSRLDYCNSLYYGISHLQLVQNAAARLLEGKRKYEHITPILMSLHWLPVKYRIDFKIVLFVYKALNNLAPQYLTGLCFRLPRLEPWDRVTLAYS